MMLIDLIVSAFLGYGLHQSRAYTAKLPDGWRELTNYSIGVAGTGPLFVFWWHKLKDVVHPFNRAFLAFLLAFIGVGAGVVAGWLIDTFKQE